MADLKGLTGKCVVNMAACMTAESPVKAFFHMTEILRKKEGNNIISFRVWM